MALVVYQGNGGTASLEEDSEDLSKKRYVGLTNQGATCYLNGLLQTLFMTPDFKKAMFAWTYNADKDGPEELCIPLQLQKLFGMLQLSTQRAVDTVALTKSFGWEGYEVFQQQDVQELTRVLFDALEETFRGTKFEHTIDELYAGELIDYIRCIDVDYQSERVDKFLDFSLTIIPFGSDLALHSLHECIETYLRPEILDGDNKYYCEAFDQRVDAIKGLKFGKLPQLMSIQLKRFVYDFNGPEIVQKKLNDQVKFPMVLDMNKYVAKRRKAKTDHGDDKGGEKEEEELVANEEFELFLLEQMQKLKHDKLHHNNNNNNNINNNNVEDNVNQNGSEYKVDADVGEEEDGSKPIFSEEDFELDAELHAFSLRNLDPLAAANNFGNVVDDPDVPNLVDLTSPDAPVDHDGEDNVCYDSMDRHQIADLRARRGEWIYELYAVLIHSGAISGGHYFAYIKDMQTQDWYDFNDASVSHIGEDIVKEAWGGVVKKSSSYSATSFGNRLSSSNAYMLMYRKVASTAHDHDHDTTTTATEDDLQVPEYIKDMIAKEEIEMLQRQQEEEELRNRLNIRVLYHGVPRNIVASRAMTLQSFLDLLWTEYDLSTLCGSTGPAADYDLFRLRDFNNYSKIVGNVYDVSSVGHKALSELLFNDYRIYCLETRTATEEWEVYLVDGMSLLVEEFDHVTQSFLEAKTIRVAKTSTVGELKDVLSKTSVIPREHMRIMKLISLGYHEARADVLPQEEKSLRDFYYIYEHARLYVESDDHNPVETSQALHVFVEVRNQVQIKYNLPHPQGGSVETVMNCVYDQLANVDSRWKVQELRHFLADKVHIPASQCRLFKQNTKGNELKDGDMTLSGNGIYTGIAICIVVGKITPPGFFSMVVQEFHAKDVILGVMVLPIFPVPSSELFLDDTHHDRQHHSVGSSSTNPWGDADRSDIAGHSTDPKLEDVLKNPSPQPDQESSELIQIVYPIHEDEDDLLDVEMDNLSNEGQCDFDELDDLLDDDVADVSPVPAYAMATAVDGGAALTYSFDEEVEDLTAMTAKVTFHNAGIPPPDYDVQFPKLRPPTPQHSSSEIEVMDVESGSSSTSMPALSIADDVQASDFGEKMVRNTIEANQFIPLDDLDILVQSNTEVFELRAMILRELIRTNRVPADLSVHRIRIRDRYNAIITKVLRDGRTLSQSGIYITDNKAIGIQILPEDECLPEEESGDAIVMVQRWNRSSWSLTERVEVLFPGNAMVSDIAKALCLMFEVPVTALRVLVVPRETSFYLYELAQKSPPRNYGRYWFDPTKEHKIMRFMSHDMRVNDGDLVILQNIDEPLYELNASDMKSMEIVEASLNNSFGWTSLDADNSVPTWYTEPSIGPVNLSSSSSRPQGSSNGIKIKTQKDRLKTAESQISGSPSTPNNNGEDASNTVLCHDCGVGTNNHDDLEFRRQGGYQLFEDLSG